MRVKRLVSISSLVIAFAGFAASGQSNVVEPRASVSIVPGTAIVGTIVEYGGIEDGFEPQFEEQFCQDGRWRESGGRVVVFGTYEVVGSSVCVKRDDGSQLCRRIYRHGDVQSMALESGSGAPPGIQVRISSNQGHCC